MAAGINELLGRVVKHSFWLSYLHTISLPGSPVGIHLAVFAEPFLSLVLSGRKTVESRFSRRRCAPFGEVAEGDVILVKEISGPVRGLTLAKRAWFHDLSDGQFEQIRKRYGDMICADDAFWETQRDATYVTLIELAETATIDPLEWRKRDRRGWVSLRSRQSAFRF